ncbi:MAG: DUF971 domain-containing protein, partial [Myxococcales bacterium]
DEFTRKRTLDVAAIPQDLKVTDVAQIGNYALGFTFSDGHATGIYDWRLLRRLGEGAGGAA